MPLPLAHPAAVLPLRRYCPRYFSFSALIIGSVVPDVAYALNFHGSFRKLITFCLGVPGVDWFANQGIRGWDGFSHTLLGSIVFCLPLGLLLHRAFRLSRAPLVATLPNPHRAVLGPLCQEPSHSVLTYLASLLIGVWSHLLWDSFAKDDWWLAKAWPVLQVSVLEAGTAHLELYQAIWMISSVGGSVILLLAYLAFLRRNGRAFWTFERPDAPAHVIWLSAVVLAGLIASRVSLRYWGVPNSAGGLFHLLHAFYGIFLTGFGCCVLVIATVAIFKRMGTKMPRQD